MYDFTSPIFNRVLRMTSLNAHGQGTLFTMCIVEDGKVPIDEQLLCLKFGFKVGTMYIEKGIFGDTREIWKTVFNLKISSQWGYNVDSK